MIITRHEPLWNPNNLQDPLPTNWKEIATKEWPMPKNFGVVKQWVLYRSAIIFPHQVETLKTQLWIRHIISLIHGDWLEEFRDDASITIHQFPILERKALTKERVVQIVWLIRRLGKPAIVHCLKWATRTWMVCSGYDIQVLWQSPIITIAKGLKHWNMNISAIREIMEY